MSKGNAGVDGLLGGRSVFTRALALLSIPLIAVFFLILLSTITTVRTGSELAATALMRSNAGQVSIRLEDRLSLMYTALNIAHRNLEEIDFSASDAKSLADSVLKNLLLSSEGVYAAWFVFESGLLGSEGRFIKSYVKTPRGVGEIRDITDELLDNPKNSLWYDYPLRSGSVYFIIANPHDYGVGEGAVYRGVLTFPVKRRGVVVGCVGLDVLYRQALNFLDDLEVMDDRRYLSLVTENGDIVYSTAGEEPGRADRMLASKDHLREALSSQRGVMRHYSAPDGEKVAVCLAPISVVKSNTRPLLYMEIPSSRLLAASMKVIRNITAISVACFLLLGAGIYYVLRSVVRPVKAITRMAESVAAGDLDVNFDPPGDGPSANELHILHRALGRMVAQLAEVHNLKLTVLRADFERDKARASTEARIRFFALASHEIRAPMSAIAGMSELLLSRDLEESERSCVQDIKVSAQSLLRIINDILDASKMEAGRFELVPGHYNLPALIGDICSVTRLMAVRKGLSFVFEPSDGMPAFLYGDAGRLRQILLNLLSNAIKYTHRGGIVFGMESDGRMLSFWVRDTGMGIRKEALSAIFDPFSRGGGTGRQIQGTGLGLSITKQLAELMGGSVAVSSEWGRGSEFVVRIPVVPGDPEKAAESDGETGCPLRWDARALVVDDDRVNLKVADGLLRMHGLRVETALSGRAALESLRERDYDLVFMDHMMPEMDGLEATKALRSGGGRNADVPVVALTASILPETRAMLLGGGMDDFLSKPIEVAKLREILARWLPEAAMRGEQAL